MRDSISRVFEIFDKCFEFANTMIFLPRGIPTLQVERFPSEHFAAEEISAVSNYESNRVFVNMQWAERCLRENIAELEFIFLHELRHFHQHEVIRHYRATGEVKSDTIKEIETWEDNFANYISNQGDEASRKANADQLCERDANAYGLILVNLMNVRNPISINLSLPDCTASDAYKYELEKSEVRKALNQINMTFAGYVPKQETVRKAPKISRNALCPCGSGLKYKKCKCKEFHEEYR